MESLLRKIKAKVADRKPEAIEQKACNSSLCQALQRYEVPDPREQPEHLEEYLEGASNGSRRFEIGTPMMVRERSWCPMCAFLWRGIKEADEFPNIDESAPCFVNVNHVFFLSPSFKSLSLPKTGYTDPLRQLGARVLIVSKSTDHNAKLARLIEPDVSVSQKARLWLMQCESQHANICPPPPLSSNRDRSDTLRVVDVIENRLVNIPWDQRYAALSYVWGELYASKAVYPSTRPLESVSLPSKS